MVIFQRKGMALLLTIQFLIVVVLMCLAVVAMVARDSFDMTRIRNSVQAYFLAEAAAEEALRDLNDSRAPTGYPKNLGIGTYSVTISNHPTIANRKLITATGTARGITKTLRIQVQNQTIGAFDYAALSGGSLTINGSNIISDGSSVNVQSNTSATLNGSGSINGSANASGSITNNGMTVPGGIHPNSPYVNLPPFDDNFFQYYYGLAAADKKTFTAATQKFSSDPCSGTTNHVVYVTGNVTLNGNFTINGCIVATGNITVNGSVTQSQFGSLPAYLSKGSITINGSDVVQGMVYAGGTLTINGSNNITGAVCSNSSTTINGSNVIHYVKPNPSGLVTSGAITIVSWSD